MVAAAGSLWSRGRGGGGGGAGARGGRAGGRGPAAPRGPGGGKGSSERPHKMAAAPGAGPPDPGASVLLSCLQVAMATGQVLFHRFFYSKSFVKHSFEVSTAEAGEKGVASSGSGEEGVVVTSISRKGVVSLGLCT